MRASTVAPGAAEGGSTVRLHFTWLVPNPCAKAQDASSQGRPIWAAQPVFMPRRCASSSCLVVLTFRKPGLFGLSGKLIRLCHHFIAGRKPQLVLDLLVDFTLGKLRGHANGILDGVGVRASVADNAHTAHTQQGRTT